MTKQDALQFLYQIDPVRLELITDPDAWMDEVARIGEAYLNN